MKKINKKAEIAAVLILSGLIVGIVMLAVVWGVVGAASSYETPTQTFIKNQSVPYNITLTGNDPVSLISITNGSVALATTNYTNYITLGIIQIQDNDSWVGVNGEIKYNDQQVGYIPAGITRIVIGFITVFLAVGILVWIVKFKD